MPTRKPCVVMESKDALGPEWDIDYTRQGWPDWGTEKLRRRERDFYIKAQLKRGLNAYYRSSGWSLYPYVESGDGCTYSPVTSQNQVKVEDIVFCEVQPGNRFYAHMVLEAQEGSSGKMRYIIGNANGHQNGWCHIEHICGRLVKVERCRN